MPLQNLVEYFNNRFEHEHSAGFRPFILENDKVSGLFGPVRIDSAFTPLRLATKPSIITAHAAHIRVSTYETHHSLGNIDNLLADNPETSSDFQSIIHFDRLCRTVHNLNYLPLAHLQGGLFLSVDPRHILGIKQDHGAYFEEVIQQCGLSTQNIVIVVAISGHYARYYPELLNGLFNYRGRGYAIALKFDFLVQEQQAFNFIENLAPNYLCLSARSFSTIRDSSILPLFHELKSRIASVGGLSILQHIDDKKSDALARNVGFDWVEGDYYAQLSHDFELLPVPANSFYAETVGC
jgi:hypothetical protein